MLRTARVVTRLALTTRTAWNADLWSAPRDIGQPDGLEPVGGVILARVPSRR